MSSVDDDAWDLQRRDGNDVGSSSAKIAGFFPLVSRIDVICKGLFVWFEITKV